MFPNADFARFRARRAQLDALPPPSAAGGAVAAGTAGAADALPSRLSAPETRPSPSCPFRPPSAGPSDTPNPPAAPSAP